MIVVGNIQRMSNSIEYRKLVSPIVRNIEYQPDVYSSKTRILCRILTYYRIWCASIVVVCGRMKCFQDQLTCCWWFILISDATLIITIFLNFYVTDEMFLIENRVRRTNHFIYIFKPVERNICIYFDLCCCCCALVRCIQELMESLIVWRKIINVLVDRKWQTNISIVGVWCK